MYVADPTQELIPGLLDADVATSPNGPPTYGVELACHAERLPQDLIDALGAAGFAEGSFPARVSPYRRQGVPIQELHFEKKGTAVFGGWTESERKVNLKMIKALFARFGIKVTPRKRTLEEML